MQVGMGHSTGKGYMYSYSGFTLLYSRNQYNTVSNCAPIGKKKSPFSSSLISVPSTLSFPLSFLPSSGFFFLIAVLYF